MPVISIDPPTGGLNAFDSVDAMPPTDAVALTNWIPRSGFVESRPGYSLHVDELGGPVETLVGWKGSQAGAVSYTDPNVNYENVFGGSRSALLDTDYQLLAAANLTIWNATVTPAVSLATGFTNDRWQTQMFNNYLVMVNGEDPPQQFDGTILEEITDWLLWNPLLGDEGEFEPFTTANEFVGCVSFKGRMYYWKAGGQSFYYCQAGSYRGEIFEFDLGGVLQSGGSIISILTWTVDPGVGPDDMIVFLFDTGEFLVYQGDDPGNVGYFEQVGRFTMPDPISIRCWVHYGADVIVLTRIGYVSMTDVMKGVGVEGDFPKFSRKIGRAVFDDSLRFASYFGHEGIQTDSGFLIFNMPNSETRSHQYIRNPNTQAWCRAEGYNALAWETFENGTFFGNASGEIMKLGGYNDNGEPIALDAIPAFNYFQDPGVQKQIVATQVISTHPEPQKISITGVADFNLPQLPNIQEPPVATGSTYWNSGVWNVDFWIRPGTVLGGTTKGWHNVHAFGYAVSVIVQMKVDNQLIQWRQTGLRYRMGGAQ